MEPGSGSAGSRSTPDRHRAVAAMAAMMVLYFIVLVAVGILRPIRNAFALDGLADTDFYQVYLVSALVIAFVPILNRLSDRIPWRRLVPGVALFFALNLLLFRVLYVEGSTVFGLVFYGWYDLFAAALVAQFFMVTQVFFHARLAKNAYPLVIAGGSLGATTGAAITGFLAETLGTPNLLLLAAVLIALFSMAVVLVWSMEGMVPEGSVEPPTSAGKKRESSRSEGLGVRAIFSNRQVLLITGLVLITILVKQLIDYQFNTIVGLEFQERDAISAFQGKFFAVTQWLPILVLLGMRVPLRRWGVGFVVLLLPVAMLLTNVGLIVFWGLWVAMAAKGADMSFRYSAERAGREILYVPVPDEIKLKAKAYIDVAVEKGVGKVASAGLIFVVLTLLDYDRVAWVGAGLSAVWIGMALAVRREYVRSLARAVENRFASLRGVFASLDDASSLRVVREALTGDDHRQIAFGLDLLEQAPPESSRSVAKELEHLLEHQDPGVRTRALDLLARVPGGAGPNPFRRGLSDPEPEVREAAVRGLHALRNGRSRHLLQELLGSGDPAVRTAALACLARGEIDDGGIDLSALEGRSGSGDGRTAPSDPQTVPATERIERALVAAALRPPDAASTLDGLLADPDPTVATAAIRSAGWLGDPRLHPRLVAALALPATRGAAREALLLQGTAVVPILARHLLDPEESPRVRRQIPAILARIPAPETVDALVECIVAPETDQLLDYRSIKALSKLRARKPGLRFDPKDVERLMARSLEACDHYARARGLVTAREDAAGPALRLLGRAVAEAWAERREEVFRCLGLIHPPAEVHRAFLALLRGDTVARANALEWLESTVGYRTFLRLEPLLSERARAEGTVDLRGLLDHFSEDEDRWIAHLADRAAMELGFRTGAPERLAGRTTMDLMEAVFMLQRIDVLRDARSAHLALVASIAEERDVDSGTVLASQGEPADALHVVVRGEVVLSGAGEDIELTDGMAFGTWALVDEVPAMVEAHAVRPTRLLRIGREEFHDLLTDHPELAIGMLQGLARRIRGLVA